MNVLDKPTPTANTSTPAPQAEADPLYTDGPIKEIIATGEATATFLAAGIGCFSLGLITTLAQAWPGFKSFLAFNDGVGPLSGKTIIAIVIWLVAWVGLHFAWRTKHIDVTKTFIFTLVLVGLGVLFTFPPFFNLFTAS